MQLRTYGQALLWFNMGFRVFPLAKGTKRPAIDDWPNAKLTQDEVEKMFNKQGYNIAVVTSNGLAVQDFEKYTDFEQFYGNDSLSRLLDQTLVVKTPHRGAHVYFRSSDPCKRSIRLSREPPLDLLGEGGYVVSPPSMIDHSLCDKGKCRREGLGSYEPLSNHCKIMEVRNLFDSTLERCKALGWKINGSSGRTFDLEKLRGGIPEGERNESLFRYALYMLNKEKLEPAFVLDALLRANARCQPPLPKNELQTIFQSALGYVKPSRETGELRAGLRSKSRTTEVIKQDAKWR